MRLYLSILALLIVTGSTLNSCSKDHFVADQDAQLEISTQLINFDTVFTSTNSITNKVKIKNLSNKKLLVHRVGLAASASSSFQLNINGEATSQKENFIIPGGDSIYIFIRMHISTTPDKIPFKIEDSIIVDYGSQQAIIELVAWGKNARFLKDYTVAANETWEADLPYVIHGNLVINAGATLNIEKGAAIYLHADAAITVKGSLHSNGTVQEPILFRGDRLDSDYAPLPGTWPGILFETSSQNNQLKHTHIKNAVNGVVALGPSTTILPKIQLDACIIENISKNGILANNSSIQLTNCLIANCGNNIAISNGGQYDFTHCTIVSYYNKFIYQPNLMVQLSNFSETNNALSSNPLQAIFTNCIIWGENNQNPERIVATKKGVASASITFQNCVHAPISSRSLFEFQNSLGTDDPAFETADGIKNEFNFRLQAISPAIGMGMPGNVLVDMDGLPRSLLLPDAGCYERQ